MKGYFLVEHVFLCGEEAIKVKGEPMYYNLLLSSPVWRAVPGLIPRDQALQILQAGFLGGSRA